MRKNVTFAVHQEPQPGLLRLQQPPVHGYLHVQGNLGVHQGLVLDLLLPQLLQQLLYLNIFGSKLRN